MAPHTREKEHALLFEDLTGYCPWHKKDSSFKIVFSTSHVTPHYYSLGFGGGSPNRSMPDDPTYTGIVVLECLHCQKSMILLEMHARLPGVDGGEEEKVWRSMVSPHPSPRSLHESAPAAVRGLFEEASRCEKAKAFRAAGVMYRAAVEELVKDQQATGGTLWHKIESLKGRLSNELVEDLHEARLLGNDSIHAGLTYSEEEVADVAGLIEEAVLVLYVQPEQKRAMRDARKARREATKDA
ncbi:DUF4145 domain-containing protein [Nocardioides sp. HB32]